MSIRSDCGLPSVHSVMVGFSSMSNRGLSDVNICLLCIHLNAHFGVVSYSRLRLGSHFLTTTPLLTSKSQRFTFCYGNTV